MLADRRAETQPWFSLAIEPAREEVRLQAIGELDLAAAPTLHQQVGDSLAAGFSQVVIDQMPFRRPIELPTLARA